MNEYFDKDGKLTQIDNALYGKTLTNNGTVNFYVKANKNLLYNPFDKIAPREEKNWNLKKVSQETYEYYEQFIKTTSVKFKLYAERSL